MVGAQVTICYSLGEDRSGRIGRDGVDWSMIVMTRGQIMVCDSMVFSMVMEVKCEAETEIGG
jgi:hypothetical protein